MLFYVNDARHYWVAVICCVFGIFVIFNAVLITNILYFVDVYVVYYGSIKLCSVTWLLIFVDRVALMHFTFCAINFQLLL